jgi:ATP-dependent DNA helicase RecG
MDILVEARREAFALVAEDPTLNRPDHRPLRREVKDLLGANVEWLFRE